MRNMVFLGVIAALFAGSPVSADDAPLPLPRHRTDDAIRVAGPMQTVFDWTNDRCDDSNIPDLPARAFRNLAGEIQLTISHITGYRMRGPSFDSLKVDCSPVSHSSHDPDPSHFSDNEWIASPYEMDDGTIYALVHDEFHGNEQIGDLCPSGRALSCWYNAITLDRSDDGGKTYRHALAPPKNLVASLPERYIPDGGPYGAFSPSNIIRHDGFYYAFFKLQTYLTHAQQTCLMRTPDLADPGAWRFWDGSGFNGKFIDPYAPGGTAHRFAHTCAPLALDDIAQIYESITWNTYLKKFVLVGTSSDPSLNPNRYGFYYALSDDLVHWQHRRLLIEVPLPWTARSGYDVVYLYPSVVDPRSQSANFETSGQTAFLYFTRHNAGQGSLDRDLVRVPLLFTKAAE